MRVNIEAERSRMQLTKGDMAKALGVTQKTYVSYLHKENSIPSDKLEKMHNLFSCSVDYLLGLSDKRVS